MNANRIATLVICSLALFAGGCLKVQAYYDPKLPETADADMPSWAKPREFDLKTEYSGAGDHPEERSAKMKKFVIRAFEDTKRFTYRENAPLKIIAALHEDVDMAKFKANIKAAQDSDKNASTNDATILLELSVSRDNQVRYFEANSHTQKFLFGSQPLPPGVEAIPLLKLESSLWTALTRKFIANGAKKGAFD